MGSSQISKKLGFDISRFAEPRQWSKALAVVEDLATKRHRTTSQLGKQAKILGIGFAS